MCGIVGIVSEENDVTERLVEGLRRLEYRGYDSAGIATHSENKLYCSRAKGKISELAKELEREPITGKSGIGHTRWATHGSPSTNNAHPHMTDKVAVIHNGIIENFAELRGELESIGYKFRTETDTEVVPVLLTYFIDQGDNPKDAMQKTLAKLEGAFALGVLFKGYDNLLFAARRGSPLAIGYGENEMFIASDAYALAPLSSRVAYLEDGDWAELTPNNIIIYDENNQTIERDIHKLDISPNSIGKGDYNHYMLKEIYEQPTVIGETINSFYNPVTSKITLPDLPFDFKDIERLSIIACGTSFYAGSVAQYWFESLAKIPTAIDVASEFRYAKRLLPNKGKGVSLFISQSGETADTLAALRYAKEQGQYIISIVNAQESSMERESDVTLNTLAGPEIGVASTKAFTTQLIVLLCLALAAAEERNAISDEDSARLSHALSEVPSRAVEVLNHDNSLRKLAADLAKAQDIIYIGRGTSYPIAMEGALKLKEISYIHAEGVAAGELKHGPIALIDEKVPVIVIAPNDELFEKTASNVQEVAARGGRVVFLSDKAGIEKLANIHSEAIELPKVHHIVAPILYAIPIQLLAYHTAVALGTDVDQPRNLAKSVTVE